jgi:HEPN domain-containing protein
LFPAGKIFCCSRRLPRGRRAGASAGFFSSSREKRRRGSMKETKLGCSVENGIIIRMAVRDEKEWFYQAEYDIETAEANFRAERHIYAIFMCHLSIEKALKGIYFKKFQKDPPKTHSLTFLLEINELEIPAELYPFLMKLSAVSVPTRYPEQLREMQKAYDRERTENFIAQSKEVLEWLKRKL